MPDLYHQLNISYVQKIPETPPESACQVHDDFAILFLLAGNGDILIEKSHYHLKSGNLIIINNGESHQPFSPAEKNCEIIEIRFDPDLLSPFSRTFNLYHCFLNRLKGDQNKLILNKPQREKILRLFNRMKDLFEHPFYADEILKYTSLVELVFYINRLFLNFSHADDLQNLPPNLAAVVEYINDNIQSELSLEMLEKKFFINKSYLERLFQKYLNISIHEYIILQRITKAKELLLDGYSALDASKKSGFNDYSNFRKMFKKITQVSPAEYIKKQHDENMSYGSTKTFRQQFNPVATGLPDLTVVDLSWSPAKPQSGAGVIFKAAIKNLGRSAVPAGVILGVGFKVDDFTETWSDNYTLGLAPGETILLNANNGQGGSPIWTATAGVHQIVAHVDDIGRLAEINKDNNLLAKVLVVE